MVCIMLVSSRSEMIKLGSAACSGGGSDALSGATISWTEINLAIRNTWMSGRNVFQALRFSNTRGSMSPHGILITTILAVQEVRFGWMNSKWFVFISTV